MKKDKKDYTALALRLCDEFCQKQNAELLANLTKRNTDALDVSRERMTLDINERLAQYRDSDGQPLSKEEKEKVTGLVASELWGYGILDELIQNRDISDVKLYGYGNIRIKTKGKRCSSGITFENAAEYRKFVTKILERNKVNLGTANAIQTFTDRSQENFILRITVISGLLCDSGQPVVAIRKIPKDKYDLDYLEYAGMFSRNMVPGVEEQKDSGLLKLPQEERMRRLLETLVTSKGILFTGKGASGKTTLMNALIAEIPSGDSVMICQENAELFDDYHPDLFSVHVMTNSGDSKVSYTLGDLTRAALLMDLDRVIVGEVKEGSEAAGLSKASMTGHKCWTSVHGESCEMAVDKMADYVSQATGYSTRDALKQLQGFEYVVHLRKFRVDEIIRIAGWDKENECLVYEHVYPFKEVQP